MLYLAYLCIILLFACASFFPIKTKKRFEFLNKNHTMVVRGLMAITIIVSHVATQTNALFSIPHGGMVSRVIGGGGALGVAVFFFLSGYGNHFSVMKLERKCSVFARWVTDRIVKTLIVFVIAFGIDIVALTIINQKFPEGTFKNLITLSMPGTTTWYLKIQLLYYVVIAITTWLLGNKKKGYIAFLMVISVAISIPFYLTNSSWWNGFTGLCFSAGILAAMYSDQIRNFVETRKSLLIPLAFFGSIICYGITVFGYGGYPVQVLVYPMLCGFVVIFTYGMQRFNNIWQSIGSASLSIYLVHIGLIHGVFANRNYTDFAFLLFTLVTVVGSASVDCFRESK